ncbi:MULTISPECIES: hypothetical protein [unclassified Streptomyces]|uniref:hypothetical protein n=1 Tax=unclassified Streptomyces TaxID=2593676 RepID=UPI0036390B52
MTQTFAALRLLPMTDREKNAEILALHHQLGLLQRQLGELQLDPGRPAVGPCGARKVIAAGHDHRAVGTGTMLA